jgi:hypothetical protein
MNHPPPNPISRIAASLRFGRRGAYSEAASKTCESFWISTNVGLALTLHDVGADGRALISRDALRAGAIGLAPGESKERDLSWQDWTVPTDLSDDGKLMLFIEAGEAGGGEYAVFTRDTTDASAVRLGQDSANAFSPDGKWALVLRQNMVPPDFVLLPTGVGLQQTLSTGNVIPSAGQFFSDSKHLLIEGHEPGHAAALCYEFGWWSAPSHYAGGLQSGAVPPLYFSRWQTNRHGYR